MTLGRAFYFALFLLVMSIFTRWLTPLAHAQTVAAWEGQREWRQVEAPESASSIRNPADTDWVPIAERQWARVLTVNGDRAVVRVLLVQNDVFFQVLTSCNASIEASVLLWRAGSTRGSTLNCQGELGYSDSPPYLEEAIGILPREVTHELGNIRTHSKQTPIRML
jgi:hypothetical protein